MNKKPIYWTCGILMVLTFLFSTVTRFQFNQRAPENYAITLPMLLDVFASQPLFYASLGLACALKLFGPLKKDGARLACLIIGIVLSLVLFAVAVASIVQADFTVMLFMLLRQLFRIPGFFLVPGILLGLGMNRAAE